MKQIIKTGDRFNRLTTIRFIEMRYNSHQYWLFRCDCGKEKVMSVNSVKNGNAKSCGCLKNETSFLNLDQFKHGMTETVIYNTWQSMIQRCLNKNHPHYKNWGGRGITVCPEWMEFENFYADMGDRPEGKSLDRIKNNLGYYKSNCQWSTPKEQCNNRRSNRLLMLNGKTQNISQWAEELGINRKIIYARIYRGWDIKRALTSNINI